MSACDRKNGKRTGNAEKSAYRQESLEELVARFRREAAAMSDGHEAECKQYYEEEERQLRTLFETQMAEYAAVASTHPHALPIERAEASQAVLRSLSFEKMARLELAMNSETRARSLLAKWTSEASDLLCRHRREANAAIKPR